MPQTLIIGVGNSARGDDAAGIAAAEEISKRNIPGVKIAVCGGEAGELLELWKGFDKVILIDAVSGGKNSGTIIRIDASMETVPAEIFTGISTHNFGVGEAVELARALGELPPKVIIYGITGKNYEIGDEIDGKTALGIEMAAQKIIADDL
jgi:hydrogenase maturation protease